MLRALLFMPFCLCTLIAIGQKPPKTLPAKRLTTTIKIDGLLDDECWKNVTPAQDWVEYRPTFGKPEDAATRTEVYLLYDDANIYIGGYCHERTVDSISKELVGRDVIGVNDFCGIIFDSYLDKINAVGFYVTPLNEQFDAKYSTLAQGEDPTWSAVWQSAAKVHADGWSFEMRIPYSALRFSNRDNQTWGLNMTRRRNKTGQQYFWNPVDPNLNGFINQEGLWTGIEKIKAPLRLSLSPYLSTYVDHYPFNTPGEKNWSGSVNGGMDLKYGINQAFTLDMTLVPDFGQVQSDNHILNLTPFEVKYNENRPFFTEGTELFNKGDLFYSRRVGGQPMRFSDVQDTASDDQHIHADEHFAKNPIESKLINATKISGRTRNGLGIGFFNAITAPAYAIVENNAGVQRKIKTDPLTNFNIIVFDQSLKNHSSVSLINTNVTRNDGYYSANVTAGLFDLNNKKNNYNINGKLAVSQLYGPTMKNTVGEAHRVTIGKTSGKWNWNLQEDAADINYNPNDLGILFNSNYLDHYLYSGYHWNKPTSWYNRVQVNYNITYSRIYSKFPGQVKDTYFQGLFTNVNANMQAKNLWFFFMFLGYVPRGNDFYEPRTTGYSFHTPSRLQFNPHIETNPAKKYYVMWDYFLGIRSLFHSPNHQVSLQQRYRFNDKFSITEQLNYNPAYNDAGYYQQYYEGGVLKDILFSRRDLTTIENILILKFNFNSVSGINFRVRHYWSKVEPKQLYDLNPNGDLTPTVHTNVPITGENINFFNIDAVYTWQFAPGSFLNIVWKNQGVLDDANIGENYYSNLGNALHGPQDNNFSVKVIYYLDCLYLKHWKKKKASTNGPSQPTTSYNQEGPHYLPGGQAGFSSPNHSFSRYPHPIR